ncbi:MAG: TIGR04552 family protein [Alphaproteobacteria bacterium]|nr:TIGR04552 family protein [Alphaproteobacteria bacterium]
MARDILNVDTSFVAAFEPHRLDLQDLEVVRLILHGTSVLDWHRLDLPDLDQVDSFLATHRIDWNNAGDRERVRFVFNQAINYLEEHHAVHFPKDLRDPDDLRTLFLEASTYTGRVRKRQALACMLLKLMHTINHMDAADLKHRAPVPEAELLDRAEKVIVEHADGMREQGFPLLAFYGSRKTRTSVITKLLSKRDSIAATIFDKLRFRVVVETQREILPVIAHLTRTLFPFNYVIPNASHNTLVNWRKAQKDEPHYAKLSGRLQRQRLRPGDWLTGNNPFSGSNYRVLNFIVDFPVRVDDLMSDLDPELRYMLGSTVYVMVEFQVVDKTTAEANELGENAHSQYKTRQRKTVETRLLRGSLSKLR